MSTPESWVVGGDAYASILLTVAYSWIDNCFDQHDNLKLKLNKNREREFGKIKASILGYTSDLHNIAINYCLLNDILTNSKFSIAKKHLYSSVVLENYFTNLRSLLDFVTNIIKISLSEKQLNIFPNSDSLNKLISFLKKPANVNKLPNEFREILIGIEDLLNEVKIIRDLIIHKGKEILISREDDKELYIRIPKTGMYSNDNMLPNIIDSETTQYKLYLYLRVITKKILRHTENIGTVMLNDTILNNKFSWTLYAITNHCLNDFNDFLLNNKVLTTIE